MTGVETRRGDTMGQQVNLESQLVDCVIRVSRSSAESLKIYLENRERLFKRCGEKSGEVEFVESLLGQVNRSLSRKRNKGNNEAVLALNIGDVGRFGTLLSDQGVRFPPLIRAMMEITSNIDKDGRGVFVKIGKFCMGVLNQIENMSH